MNYSEVLRGAFLFKTLSPQHLQLLASAASERFLDALQELCREGEPGDEMWVVAMGTVRVLKKNRDGADEEVATLGTGSYFGEVAFVALDHLRQATIVAQESSRLLGLKRDVVESLVKSDADFGCCFYRAIAQGLARRLSTTTQDVSYYKMLYKRGRHGD